MEFDIRLILVIVFSLLSIVFVTLFFKRYGAFKHNFFVWFLMLFSATLPFIMVVGFLPYDISLCLFGTNTTAPAVYSFEASKIINSDLIDFNEINEINQNDNNSTTEVLIPHETLRITLEVFYWVSFVLTWVINPFIVSYLRYPYSLTLKRRIWLTIRENLIFWGTIVAVVVVGVIILFATGNMTWANLFPLAISLANGYGLLVMCFCLGHGYVALPRYIWQMANPASSYLYFLQEISKETSLCASTVADGDALLTHCQNAKDQLVGQLKRLWEEKGTERMNKLSRTKGELPIPRRCRFGEAKNKKVKKLQKMNWKKCTESQLEDFFDLLDSVCLNIEETASYVNDSAKDALKHLKRYNKQKNSCMTVIKRIGAVLLFMVNLVCVWSEVCLIFNIKYSLFYFISHFPVNAFINIVCISTPILTYLICVGSWSLKHLRLGSFFRFIVGKTNANTLNYFSIILCRLGPTIGFHYLQQIGAYQSQFQKVMGKMDVVVFVGTKWNIYSPILLILVMVFVAFRVIDRIAMSCGKDTLTYDTSIMDLAALANGQEVLVELENEAKVLVDSGLKYSLILDKATIFKSKKTQLEENLMSDGSSSLYEY